MPNEYWDWEIVAETGWPLEYVRSLSLADFHAWLQIRDAKYRARQSQFHQR